jgi:hypothetical protein
MRALSRSDWQLLAEAVAGAVALEVGLRVFPFNRLLTWFDGSHREHGSTAPEIGYDACRRAVDRAYQWMPVSQTCLKHSLVLYRLLRRRGLAVRFRLGVRRDRESIGAHAWVEWEPGESPAAQHSGFLPFPQSPGGSSGP